jgi:surface protein
VLKNKIRKKQEELTSPHGLFKNEDGAIDLASIMVGIIVIGLIGGVIAATVFTVIPWTQDNAAKHQLDSVTAAESAYFGLSADNPPALPAGAKANSFGNSAELQAANLLTTGKTYCVTTPADGKSYTGFSQSASGKVWSSTDKNTKPVIFTGTLPTDCQFITDGITAGAGGGAAPYVDPTPNLTVLTYKCDVAITGALPMRTALTGTETWSDGVTQTYSNTSDPVGRTFAAGVEYKVTFDGTYQRMMYNQTQAVIDLTKCLRSVDHWGQNSGVTDASSAFMTAANLTAVPANIPSTITNLSYLFYSAGKINDPNISNWDTSNVTNMYATFNRAGVFNQPLNNWNTSKVTDMQYMFTYAVAFNQPLDKWDTSKVTNMSQMFANATIFNKPLNSWNVSNVADLSSMFSAASSFNQPLDKWNTAKVTNMSSMFLTNAAFNQNLSGWNTTVLTSGANFAPNTFPTEYLPPKTTKAA